MKYEIRYLKPKKKGYAQHNATFLDIRDAMMWERLKKQEGCKDFQILIK